jgi:hypothetical protein
MYAPDHRQANHKNFTTVFLLGQYIFLIFYLIAYRLAISNAAFVILGF